MLTNSENFELQILDRFKNGISYVHDLGANMRYSSELIESKKQIRRIGLVVEDKQHKINEANFNQLMKDQNV